MSVLNRLCLYINIEYQALKLLYHTLNAIHNSICPQTLDGAYKVKAKYQSISVTFLIISEHTTNHQSRSYLLYHSTNYADNLNVPNIDETHRKQHPNSKTERTVENWQQQVTWEWYVMPSDRRVLLDESLCCLSLSSDSLCCLSPSLCSLLSAYAQFRHGLLYSFCFINGEL